MATVFRVCSKFTRKKEEGQEIPPQNCTLHVRFAFGFLL